MPVLSPDVFVERVACSKDKLMEKPFGLILEEHEGVCIVPVGAATELFTGRLRKYGESDW